MRVWKPLMPFVGSLGKSMPLPPEVVCDIAAELSACASAAKSGSRPTVVLRRSRCPALVRRFVPCLQEGHLAGTHGIQHFLLLGRRAAGDNEVHGIRVLNELT